MQVHSNAKTTPAVRRQIQSSSLSYRSQADRYAVAVSTIHRWAHRTSQTDRSSRPRRVREALSSECRELALKLRSQGLTLDQCLDALRESFPQTSRSTLHRLFVREGVSRLRQEREKRRGTFKDYKPGFVHIDQFYLPALGGKKRYCFVAIDRATRLAFLKVYDRKTKQAAQDFLLRAFKAFPFKVHRLMSDNGPEFTNRHYKRVVGGARQPHPLDLVCTERGIARRFSKPYVPATNGMAERFVGLSKRATVSAKRYDSHRAIEADLHRWLQFYNNARPHGSIQRMTPIQKAIEWYKLHPDLFTRKPDPETVLNLLRLDI